MVRIFVGLYPCTIVFHGPGPLKCSGIRNNFSTQCCWRTTPMGLNSSCYWSQRSRKIDFRVLHGQTHVSSDDSVEQLLPFSTHLFPSSYIPAIDCSSIRWYIHLSSFAFWSAVSLPLISISLLWKKTNMDYWKPNIFRYDGLGMCRDALPGGLYDRDSLG